MTKQMQTNYAEYGAILHSILGQIESLDRAFIGATAKIKSELAPIFKSTKPMFLQTTDKHYAHYYLDVVSVLMDSSSEEISAMYRKIPKNQLVEMAEHAIDSIRSPH